MHLVEPRSDDMPLSVLSNVSGSRPDSLAPFRQVFGGPLIVAGGHTGASAAQAVQADAADAVAFGCGGGGLCGRCIACIAWHGGTWERLLSGTAAAWAVPGCAAGPLLRIGAVAPGIHAGV